MGSPLTIASFGFFLLFESLRVLFLALNVEFDECGILGTVVGYSRFGLSDVNIID